MRLISLDHWRTQYFGPESRPALVTVRRWIKQNAEKLGARKVGGTWFIDEHKWLADGDPLVERALQG